MDFGTGARNLVFRAVKEPGVRGAGRSGAGVDCGMLGGGGRTNERCTVRGCEMAE